MTPNRSSLGAAVGGVLLGVLSMVWLSKSLVLILGNARCCLLADEGDARRGIFFAAIAGCLQLGTLALAVVVVRHRAQRAALVVVGSYVVITVVLMIDGGAGEVQLWLNLIALVVAGLALLVGLLSGHHRSRPEPRV